MVNTTRKLAWGVRAVGIPHSVLGAARFIGLLARRPDHGEIRLRSGGILTFANPSQRVPALVVFGDVIDPELLLLRRLLTSTSVVVDVGAAIGQFTVVAGQTPGVVVYAYEPSSTNLSSLRRNIAVNDLANRVTVRQAALSSSAGTATFRTTPNTFLSGLSTDDSPAAGETVPVVTITDELRRLGRDHIDVLKVNVAGYEAEVLEGAMPALENGAVHLLIVLISTSVIPVLQRIQRLDYRFFFYDPYKISLHELERIDVETLRSPPTPARHVLAIRSDDLSSGPLGAIPVVRQRVHRGR